MARITSSVGLITGLNIDETVKQLMAVAAQPRDLLKSRTDSLKQEQTALDTLGSRLLAFQFAANKLKSSSVFTAREVTSSNAEVLQASLPSSGTPAIGSFQIRPVQTASAQQLVSQRFDLSADDFGSGELSFRVGGFLDQGISLDELNGGAGVQRGKIRITDRSGTSAVIDLSAARTVDDVLDAINSHSDVAVTASTDGDSFVLTDSSSGSGNLTVHEVSGGSTAAGLGLAGISVAGSQASGADVFRLHAGTKLATLNDANGVQITRAGVIDLDVDLSDGTNLQIDLAGADTLGAVLDQINAADPARLQATISADGNRLEVTDLTSGSGDFTIANGVASAAAVDLGIAATTAGNSIAGGRIASGLRDTLLSSLKGGQGVGALGQISVTDRAGSTAIVDLEAAETLSEVIDLINSSSAEVTAAVNAARNGFQITDNSGGAGNLIIADADGTNSATALGIATNQAATAVNSGALQRQTMSEATLLSSLNGGKGATIGDIKVINSAGVSKSADMNTPGNEAKTVGDVINAINALNNGVQARINDAGDGVLLVDVAGGANALGVTDVSGTIAESLNLTRASQTIDVGGTQRQAIDGTSSYSVDLANLQATPTAIPLSSLNGGNGVAAGDIIITDSTGEKSLALDLNGVDAGIATVGQLIDAINSKAAAGGVGVTARLNDAGTGIHLEDTAGGPKKLTVKDTNSTAAADLKIAGEATVVAGKQVINGAGAFTANSGAQTALGALAARINELDAGVTASTVFDGVGYRLSLTVDATGSANELLIDAGDSSLAFEEISKAQDALLLYGTSSVQGAGVLVSSPTNTFERSVGGVNITISSTSDTPIAVSVAQTDESLVTAVEELVEAYNSLRDDLDKLTAFDAEALTTGLLFGSNEALQIDSRLSRALTNRYFNAGEFQSLEQLGVSVDKDGKLELNKTRLRSAFDRNPTAVREFLASAESGFADKVSEVVDLLVGDEGSLIATRSDSLRAKIESNETRLDRFEVQLEKQQDRLLLQFYQLETMIAKLQEAQSALSALQPLAPLS